MVTRSSNKTKKKKKRETSWTEGVQPLDSTLDEAESGGEDSVLKMQELTLKMQKEWLKCARQVTS